MRSTSAAPRRKRTSCGASRRTASARSRLRYIVRSTRPAIPCDTSIREAAVCADARLNARRRRSLNALRRSPSGASNDNESAANVACRSGQRSVISTSVIPSAEPIEISLRSGSMIIDLAVPNISAMIWAVVNARPSGLAKITISCGSIRPTSAFAAALAWRRPSSVRGESICP